MAALPAFDLSGLDLRVESDGARVAFTSAEPGFCSVLMGTRPGDYSRMVVESMPGAPHTAHVNELRDLKPGTTYYFRVLFTNAAARVQVSGERSFATPAAAGTQPAPAQSASPSPPGDASGQVNVARLEAGARIAGVSSNYGGGPNDGPWGASAAIDGGDGTVLGPFPLTGPDRLDIFPLDRPVTSERFRFEVERSTGGNTGAREIALFIR